MTQTALAADVDLTKVAIGGLVARMEVAGFLERRADELDARVKRIHLTPAGTKMLAKIRRSIETVENDIIADVGEDDLSTTAATLAKIKVTLREMVGFVADEGLE